MIKQLYMSSFRNLCFSLIKLNIGRGTVGTITVSTVYAEFHVETALRIVPFVCDYRNVDIIQPPLPYHASLSCNISTAFNIFKYSGP